MPPSKPGVGNLRPAKGIFVAREMIESYYKNVYFFGKDHRPSPNN